MSWVGIILWLVMHAGDIIALIRQFIDLLHGMPRGQREILRSVLTDAIKKDDVSAAKQVIHDTCSGVGCAPDLVRE